MLHHHVHSLFDAVLIPRESAPQLRKLIDETCTLKHLRTLGQPTEQSDCLMIYLEIKLEIQLRGVNGSQASRQTLHQLLISSQIF